ncbi:hypothetical protein P4S63_23125 [Pseudoalteromonas sp. B193]
MLAYREHVDSRVIELLKTDVNPHIKDIIELGLHHEQQHQELMLMDIKYNFSVNPLFPQYKTSLLNSQKNQLILNPLILSILNKPLLILAQMPTMNLHMITSAPNTKY